MFALSIGDADDSSYDTQYEKAVRGGCLADDIKDEQAKIKSCDLLILLFPLTLFSYPAKLKGWIDRVFGNGFGYSFGSNIKKTETLKVYTYYVIV